MLLPDGGPSLVRLSRDLGVDHARFRPLPLPKDLYQRFGLDPDRPYLLYVGTEDPRKDLPTLLRAFARVRRERPDVGLIKVGRAYFDSERARLRSLIRDLHLEDAVHFLDNVDEADLPLLYNLARIFITPSLYEGFGFPALEAMACGRPVVATRAGSLPEIVGQAGILVPPGDERTMAETLLRLLDDQVMSDRLGELCLARAAGFTWERTVRETVDVYLRASDSRPAAHRAVQGDTYALH